MCRSASCLTQKGDRVRKLFPTHVSFTPGLSLAAFLLFTVTASASSFNFQTLDNPGDPAFNQLLGINNAGEIVGYFGDGTVQPNKGYTLAPPYAVGNFTDENFPSSVQTQVVGINNNSSPVTVGFYIDAAGNNFGFYDIGGTFTSVKGPDVPNTGLTTTQLLGINDSGKTVGFDTDGGGANHGIVGNTSVTTAASITLPVSFNATSVTLSGVNNANMASGFYMNTGGTHGFICNLTTSACTSYDDPNGTNTMFLGINNKGQVAGSFVDMNGETQGLLFDSTTSTYQTISDPFASATVAFNVNGTTVNGLNDNGQLVGFYSDGTNVNGFLATVVPEPASIALMLLGAAVVFRWRLRRRNA